MSRALLLLVLCGCGRVSDWGTPWRSDAMLPHPDGWEAAAGHGTVWLERGAASCVECHEVEAGSSFCGECHDSYPHRDDWLEGSQHGEGTYGKGGKLRPCQDCHEADGSAAARLPCTGCHASYPHEEGWEQAGEHGAWLLERGALKVACTPCHGEELDGGNVSEACASCHPSYPHPDAWGEGEQHGRFDTAGREALAMSGCQRCHGVAEGGLAGTSCARCHASYPHGPGWQRGHVRATGQLGEGTCTACHQAGDGPAALPASCAPTCHGGEQ